MDCYCVDILHQLIVVSFEIDNIEVWRFNNITVKNTIKFQNYTDLSERKISEFSRNILNLKRTKIWITSSLMSQKLFVSYLTLVYHGRFTIILT